MTATPWRKSTMKNSLKFVALGCLALSAQAALAQSAGTWMVRAGFATIAPQVSSGTLSAPSLTNSKADVGSASQFAGGITYMYTDNLSVDVPLALPFKHKIYGAGALSGVGQIGEVQVLPMTVAVQYRFNEANAQFRPYVGLGATYANFFNATGSGTLTALTNTGGTPTGLSVESRFALTPQVGATFAVNDKWFVDLYLSKTMLTTQTKLSTGQVVDIALDPVSYGLSVGYKFR
jgi:outer membrane protein